jgi:hypothetical protein
LNSTLFNNYLYYATISPAGVCITRERLANANSNFSPNFSFHEISREINTTKTDISFHSIRRLKRAFNLLLAISPLQTISHPSLKHPLTFRINFITLTLSAKQAEYTDKQIKRKLLNHFIVEAKRKFKMKHYIWKAEKQKNGNIHFHFNTNVFIHYQELRDLWNNIQNKLEFVNIFNEKFNHSNPNSTDIKAVYKDKDLAAYMAKYMSKSNSHNMSILGKYFDCSRSLKTKKKCQIECYDNDFNELMKLYEKKNGEIIEDDFYDFIVMNDEDKYKFLPNSWLAKYEKYINNIKNYA